MKQMIYFGILLGVIVIGFSSCARLFGGISKNKAAKNIETYLQREYKDELDFKNLNRFFNAATMNPNMFSVHIYNKKIPEIEFYTHINAKNILVNDTLPLYGSEKLTFNDLYKESINIYETKQAIRNDFKSSGLDVNFKIESIELIFKEDLTPQVLDNLIPKFMERLNQSYNELNSLYSQHLLIKTPQYPEGFIEIPLETHTNTWQIKDFLLSKKIQGFPSLQTKIEEKIGTNIREAFPYFKISNYRKIYLDKSSLSKAAWVQYLDDKRIKNDGEGKYQNPQKGLYILYFDLDTRHIYRGEMITDQNDTTSYEEEFNQIKNAIEAEGINAIYQQTN
ncbi:hypothetical protein [Salegentibacter maritimus]|uniref:Lipoprotein n=1 Tax=Salegentibacter maritimus TaxID=2794347 RepID=A0ABS0TIJ6_9FLAO|nr:hypothetical protein [Salegentibacter maritimus]MBI6120841.1 hypothetical protein [Salegentibacter maritimus]